MVTLKDAAQQALEALEACDALTAPAVRQRYKALANLHAALAEQPAEQEPVAWMTHESKNRLRNGGNSKGSVPVHKNPSHTSCIPLYTTPHPRREVELTKDDILELAEDYGDFAWQQAPAVEFARAVIAAYKAKQGET